MKLNKALQDLNVTSRISFGCMGLGGGWNTNPISREDITQVHAVIDCALEHHINLFDHADIYTFGKAESAFGQALQERPELRDQIVIQSKCGIRFEDELGPKRYDFSPQWIEHSVNDILNRLQIEHLPILLLHRPDPLMDPQDVADCLNQLQQKGKVGQFGVSNMSASQIALLSTYLKTPLIVNQLEMSLSKLDWLEQGVMHNVGSQCNSSMPLGTIEYSMEKDIQLQSWGCLSQGLFSGRDIENESEVTQKTAARVAKYAAEYETSLEAIVLAWLMRHPANIMPVIGTTNLNRIIACSKAESVSLSREHWYDLYVTARGNELP